MKLFSCGTGAAAIAAALSVFLGAPARAQAPDSLTLLPPADVKVWNVYNPSSKRFQVFLTWRDNPNNVSTFITDPDTTGWALSGPSSAHAFPTVTGAYTGDIDRTVIFQSTRDGVVGTDDLLVTYSVRREEFYNGSIHVLPGYVPGTPINLPFRDERTNTPIDFGLQVSFTAGQMSALGSFIVGLEDFEGFHIWRGIESDGRDLEVIGELSKEEAIIGDQSGGSVVDSVYYYDIIPTLRTSSPWISPFGAIECLGTRIDLDLEQDEYFWFDCNASNGFTYYYAVTTFDRGYEPQSSSQGLTKVDNCLVTQGRPYECSQGLTPLIMEVTAQADLYNVYVVPNPVRTGSSRLTTDNYHNFPDGLVRFVNVPPNCIIKIFTVSGDLVWQRDHGDGTGNVEWDTRNMEEQDVASGVYVYRIESESDSVFGRIVVIR